MFDPPSLNLAFSNNISFIFNDVRLFFCSQSCLEFYDLFSEISRERLLVGLEYTVTSGVAEIDLLKRILVKYTAKMTRSLFGKGYLNPELAWVLWIGTGC